MLFIVKFQCFSCYFLNCMHKYLRFKAMSEIIIANSLVLKPIVWYFFYFFFSLLLKLRNSLIVCALHAFNVAELSNMYLIVPKQLRFTLWIYGRYVTGTTHGRLFLKTKASIKFTDHQIFYCELWAKSLSSFFYFSAFS